MATGRSEKASGAFRTIGELSAELGLPQHRLRYWETRFPQLRPLQRAGQRRYYRPEDVELVRRIHRLLNQEGYTIRGVQRLLNSERGRKRSDDVVAAPEAPAPSAQTGAAKTDFNKEKLREIRDRLSDALKSDRS